MSALLWAGLAATWMGASAPSEDAVLFRAMEDELARARTLHLDQTPPPYFLQTYGNQDESFAVSASMGALTGRGGSHRAGLGVQVRVGDAGLDSSNSHEHGFGPAMGHGGGSPAELNYDALRHALWLDFDVEYKRSVEALASKRAFLETKKILDRPPDFSPAQVVSRVFPVEPWSVDRERWSTQVKRMTAGFRTNAHAQSANASFSALRRRFYLLTSEGGRTAFDERLAQLWLSASGQAPDGMGVEVEWMGDVRLDTQLPSDAFLAETAQSLQRRLDALVRAPPLAEDYAGPVLFVGSAAAVFFLETVGEPLSHPRDGLGEQRQGRMTDRLGKHVAVNALTVRDDPTQSTWRGQPLLGYFPVDDDAVAPQPITLIQAGVLQTYFMSRTPTAKVHVTNGHCRGTQGSVGNLFVETSQPESERPSRSGSSRSHGTRTSTTGCWWSSSAGAAEDGATKAVGLRFQHPFSCTGCTPTAARSWSGARVSRRPRAAC